MLEEMGKAARSAAREISRASTETKNSFLNDLADLLWVERSFILANNEVDIEKAQENGLSPAMVDRLTLNADRLSGIANDLRSVASLDDPVGTLFDAKEMPNGLKVAKQRVPLGVLGVIYESRPNVTIDIAGLGVKSGNAVILRGGSETIHSNQALVRMIHMALEKNSLPVGVVQFIDSPDRALVYEMLLMADDIDMIIPRGGQGLHKFCRENSRIPVMTGGIGICHLFIDQTADLQKSLGVVRNAKIQRPTVCNALDTVLVHRSVAEEFLPVMVSTLAEDGVRFKAHENASPYLQDINGEIVQPAGADDFDQEWLSLVLGIKVVETLDEAIEHIQAHSTGHSDGLLTEDPANAEKFLAFIDSAVVYVNASTRFTDGSELGLGAEVAVSTQRLHARGPMALQELTTYKWLVRGDYTIRA
jgi:glutamate-5-semialdehyde dehydrogenase